MENFTIPSSSVRQISDRKATIAIGIALVILGVSLTWSYSKIHVATSLSSSEASEIAAITCPVLVSGIAVGSSDVTPDGPIYQLQTYLALPRVRTALVVPDYHIEPNGVFDDPTRLTIEAMLRTVWKTDEVHEITPDVVQLIAESCATIKTQSAN